MASDLSKLRAYMETHIYKGCSFVNSYLGYEIRIDFGNYKRMEITGFRLVKLML